MPYTSGDISYVPDPVTENAIGHHEQSQQSHQDSLVLQEVTHRSQAPNVPLDQIGQGSQLHNITLEEVGQRSHIPVHSSSDDSLINIVDDPCGYQDDITLLNNTDQSSHPDQMSPPKVTGHKLLFQQFCAILIKRLIYTRRNWKGLFTQVLLPAIFVCVAMTVALTGPKMLDEPPLVLSPTQFYNYTQPVGNFIPYTNVNGKRHGMPSWSKDASAHDLISTFKLPSGVGSICVLKSPLDNPFEGVSLRHSHRAPKR